jgi:GR25 family glycosyltransferase involved in LPS biosynthesis
MSIPIYCINLESSKQRKSFIEKEWIEKYGFDIKFWKATSKNDPIIQNIEKKTPHINRTMGDGEIALIHSTITLLEYLINNNIKEAIIMEDDVFPNPIFNFISNINLPQIMFNYIEKCKKEFQNLNILMLHRVSCKNSFGIEEEFEYCYKTIHPPWGAQMNYYNSVGIKKFYDNIKDYQILVDHYGKMKGLWGFIGLTKTPFAFHYETKVEIRHKNFNSDIGLR